MPAHVDLDAVVAMPPTARQLEILVLRANGSSLKAIARALGLADQTVKNTLSATYERMQVGNSAAALIVALLAGWVTLDAAGVRLTDADHRRLAVAASPTAAS